MPAMTADALAPAASRTPSTPASAPPPRAANLIAILALALLVFATSWLSLTYTRFDSGVSTVWLANGLVCGAVLLSPRREWLWYFLAGALAQALARVLRHDSALVLFVLVLANMVECAIVAFWVRRREGDLDRARSLPRLSQSALGSTLVACACSALIAAPVLALRTEGPASLAWATWYGAHVLGMVIVATLVVCFFQPQVRMLPDGTIDRLDYAGCLALLMLVCWTVFSQDRFPVLFVVFLPLLLLAWRHGLSGTVVGVVVLAATSGLPATKAEGPFALVASNDPTVRLLFWQAFIASGCLLAYASAVSLTRRKQLERRLQRSESRFRLLADYSQDLIIRRLHGRRAYVSPASLSLLGYEPDALPPMEEMLHPEDRERVLAQFRELFSGAADTATLRYRARHRDGH